MLCVFPIHLKTIFNPFSHNKCVLLQKFFVLLESPDRHSLLFAVNTSTSLPGSEHTEVFRCPHSQKSRGLRSRDRAGQLTGPPRPVDCRPKVNFRSCLTMRGHLRTSVCSDVDVLQQRAENTCREIRVKPGMFEKVRTSYEKKI
jgi:hypothetical protein